MYNTSAYRDTYLEDRVMSASPVELVQMLYEGAIEAVEKARVCLRAGDIAGRAQAISKASAIVGELAQSLGAASAGADAPEFERNLRRLYEFVIHCLLEANAAQTEAPLEDAGRVLVTLLEAWRTVEAPADSARSAAAGQLALQA
jgi:flagellar secretion chaperone FliS